MWVYYEIWLDGEKVVGDEYELLYGFNYLLCKFKIGLVILLFNDVDVFV